MASSSGRSSGYQFEYEFRVCQQDDLLLLPRNRPPGGLKGDFFVQMQFDFLVQKRLHSDRIKFRSYDSSIAFSAEDILVEDDLSDFMAAFLLMLQFPTAFLNELVSHMFNLAHLMASDPLNAGRRPLAMFVPIGIISVQQQDEVDANAAFARALERVPLPFRNRTTSLQVIISTNQICTLYRNVYQLHSMVCVALNFQVNVHHLHSIT